MSESKYRGFTEAQDRAHKKYMEQFTEVKVRMSPERRDKIKEIIKPQSLSSFFNKAVDEKIERDFNQQPPSG